MPSLKRWNGSAWVAVPDGTAVKFWDGGAWVNPSTVRYWNGSSWVTAWNKSDPQTLTVDADFTSAVRYNGAGSYPWDPTNEGVDDEVKVRFGAFRGTYPYHYLGIIGFPMSTIISAMETRPNIVSARLRMNRESGVGWGTVPSTTPIRIGSWTQGSWRSTPTINDPANYTDFAPLASPDIGGWNTGNLWMNINAQHAQDLVNGRALVVAEVTTGWNVSQGSGGTWTDAYSRCGGVAAGTRPRLEVTIDY